MLPFCSPAHSFIDTGEQIKASLLNCVRAAVILMRAETMAVGARACCCFHSSLRVAQDLSDQIMKHQTERADFRGHRRINKICFDDCSARIALRNSRREGKKVFLVFFNVTPISPRQP